MADRHDFHLRVFAAQFLLYHFKIRRQGIGLPAQKHDLIFFRWKEFQHAVNHLQAETHQIDQNLLHLTLPFVTDCLFGTADARTPSILLRYHILKPL